MRSLAKRFAMAGCIVLLLPAVLWAAPDRGVRVQERRYALIIGNGAYGTHPLRNPPNDAQDMAQLLQQLGFTVVLKKNADKRTMKEAIRDLQKFLNRGGVGLSTTPATACRSAGGTTSSPWEAKSPRSPTSSTRPWTPG